MIREMGSRTQLLDWMAWNDIEPFGDLRRDYQAAQVVAALVNIYRNKAKFPEPFPTSMFLLSFGQPDKGIPKAKKKDWRELKAMAKVLAQMYNDELKPKRRRRQNG